MAYIYYIENIIRIILKLLLIIEYVVNIENANVLAQLQSVICIEDK